MTLLSELTSAVVKAVPEIRSESWAKPHEGVALFEQFNAETGTLDRPITLEDVLRAIERSSPEITQFYDEKQNSPSKFWITGIHTDGSFLQCDYMAGGYLKHYGKWKWKMGEPLSGQSDKIIKCLHTRLCR